MGGTWCGPESDAMHRWLTIDDIDLANANAGFFFFSDSTKRFFKSRISAEVYQGKGGYFFVTSEQPPDGVRAYTVRKFDVETARVLSPEGFNDKTRRQAHYAARKLAAGDEARTYNTQRGTGNKVTHA